MCPLSAPRRLRPTRPGGSAQTRPNVPLIRDQMCPVSAPSEADEGVHGLPHCTGYQRQSRSRFPEARHRVSQAGSGAQGQRGWIQGQRGWICSARAPGDGV
eukprot:5173449-Pyramimonas_sp.AAC.2